MNIAKSRKLTVGLIFLFSFILIMGAYRGNVGHPIYFQSDKSTAVGSPFESSGSSSRYALTEAIVKNRTFFFTDDQAKFSAPDIVFYKNKFFTIFTPGVSFLGVPLYILGNLVGLPQFFTYFLNIILALINVVLITKIAINLGAKLYSGLLSGLIFLFATDSLSYTMTFTQHQASTCLILLAIINAFSPKSLRNNLLFGAIFGASMFMDIPNLLIIFPFLIYIILQHINSENGINQIKLKINLKVIGVLAGFIPFLVLFGWYNHYLTGSFTKIGQSIGQSDYPPAAQVQNQSVHDNSVISQGLTLIHTPYNPRLQLLGLDTLLISKQRGIFYYSPIILIGLLGMLIVGKSKQKTAQLAVLLSSTMLILVSYSMFGAPEGGWAFGPRYLIPATAIVCSFIGIALEKIKNNRLGLLVFLLLLAYSCRVGALGALTTNAVPPDAEEAYLVKPVPANYDYNIDLLEENFSSSLIFNLFFNQRLTAYSYYYIYLSSVLALLIFTLILFEFDKKRSEQ